MKLLTSLFALIFSISAFAQDSITISVPKKQKSFQVILPGNATTGFQWTVQSYDTLLLQLKESHYQAPKTKLIGAGGNMIFTFNLIDGKTYPAQTDMVFKYARSWEPKSAMLKNVSVHFTD